MDMHQKLAEGKTKIIFGDEFYPQLVRIWSKDDITAGNGARHDIIPGKGALSNAITCEVFDFLSRTGIPLAYQDQRQLTSFVAKRCTMYPYEVVVRGVVGGSFRKRMPHAVPGRAIMPESVELYLKTNGTNFRGIEVPTDDPYIVAFDASGVTVVHPGEPVTPSSKRVLIPADVMFQKQIHPLGTMKKIALSAFRALEFAFKTQNCRLHDFKVEFGVTNDNELVIADVIDPDSWRLTDEYDRQISKQPYRDGASIGEMLRIYQEALDRVKLFTWIPNSAFERHDALWNWRR